MSGEYPLPPERQAGEWMREIERRLSELEGARGAGFTNVSQGAFTVTDASGVVRARVGLLDNDEYGIEVDDASGVPIDVGGSLFGLQAVTAHAVTAITGSDDAPQSLGMLLPVVVGATGRIVVIVSATLWVTADDHTNPHEFGVNVTLGYDSYIPHLNDPAPLDVGTAMFPPATGTGQAPGLVTDCARASVLTLDPGPHTLKLYGYAFIEGSVTIPGYAYVTERSIVALPL